MRYKLGKHYFIAIHSGYCTVHECIEYMCVQENDFATLKEAFEFIEKENIKEESEKQQ